MEETCKELGRALASKRDTISHLGLIRTANIISPSSLKSFVNLTNLSISYDVGGYEDTSKEIECLRRYLAIS